MNMLELKPEDRRNFGKIVPSSLLETKRDQADGIRHMMQAKPRHARVLAVTSGKGGVGKTNVSVNLALSLAAMKKQVVLIDLDLGLANADVILNLTAKYNLSNVLQQHKTIEEVMVQTTNGLYVVPGASGVERLANLTDHEREQLLLSFDVLYRNADYIVFDTGAGISKNTTQFLAAADDIIVVTIPEPTAIVDAYAVIKMLADHQDRGNIYILLNMADSRQEAERFATGISVTANKLLNVHVDKLGYILRDPKVPQAVRRRQPFFAAYPGAPASRCLKGIADRFEAVNNVKRPDTRPGFVRRLFSVFGGRK